MSGNRLLIAIVVAVGLLALVVVKWNQRDAEYTKAPDVTVKLPKLKKDDVTELSVAAPDKPAVTLKKVGEVWTLTKPLETAADKESVETALSKLEELEVIGVAATRKENHDALEVTAEKAVHIVAKQDDKTLLDVYVGAYRSGNTMVREEGADNVATTKGSFKFAFDKDLKDWRDKVVVDAKLDDVATISFKNKNGTFSFVKEGSDWKQAPGEKAIAGFESGKIVSLAGTATSMRVADFAAEGVTADAAGVGTTPVGTVQLTTNADAGAKEIVFYIGNKTDGGYYAKREGNPTIYIVSDFAGDRMTPGTDKFVKDKEPEKAAGGAPPAGAQQMMGGNNMPPGVAEALRKAGVQQMPAPQSPH